MADKGKTITIEQTGSHLRRPDEQQRT